MKLTDEQTAKCMPYFKNKLIRAAALPLVNYKKDDKDLALFRVTAYNALHGVLWRHVLGMRQTNYVSQFFGIWLSDPGAVGDLVRHFVAVVEQETGKTISFGK